MEKLKTFVQLVLSVAERVKAIVVCQTGEEILSQGLCSDACFDLDPLSFKMSVMLFGSKCRHVLKHHCPTAHAVGQWFHLCMQMQQV